jgi:hypothetical protein
MRGGRSFLVLVAVAVALGAYIYFIESKRTGSDEKKKDKVFTVDASKIEEIEVHAASGETTTLKKAGTDWQIVAPEAVEADATTVGTLVSTIESLEVGRVVNDNPASVKEVRPRSAEEQHRLQARGRDDVPQAQPRRQDADGVGSLCARGRSAEAAVDRRVQHGLAQPDAVRSARQDDPQGPARRRRHGEARGRRAAGVALTRKADEWRLTEPVSAKADFGTVDGLVGQVSSARMKAIETPGAASAAQLSAADLSRSSASRSRRDRDARRRILARHAPDRRQERRASLYARDLARPGLVFTVETALLTALQRKPDDLRVKDVFEFRSFSAQNVAFTIGGQTYQFAKEKAPPKPPAPGASPTPTPTATPAPAEPDVWKLKTPTAKDVDQAKATDLLSAFSNLRADKFTDKAFTGSDIVVVAKTRRGVAEGREDHIPQDG